MMKEVSKTKHTMTAELESIKEHALKKVVASQDILLDIKALISEYYNATFTAEQDQLKIAFNNGQAFVLTVAED